MPWRVAAPGPGPTPWGAPAAGSSGLLAALVVGLVGCAGAATATPTSTAPVATVSAASVVTVVTTEEAPPTTAPSVVVAPVTAPVPPPTNPVPSTTPPPVTTSPADPAVPPRVTFPDDPTRQAVVDAAYAFFDAARAAQASPTDAGLRNVLAGTVTDPLASRVVAFLDGLVADGVRIVGSESSPTYLEIIAPTVVVADGSALFDVCAVDSDVRLDVATEAVVDDDVVSAIQTYQLKMEGGSWIVIDLSILNRYEAQVGCN